MAQKRMFDKAIIDTDRFMDLSMSSKALYFLLGMEADDEGFVSYKKVMRIHGGNEDDVKVLVAKHFLIHFESGVVVITDWNKNNWLDVRRTRSTEYQKEKSQLVLTENNEYVLSIGLASAKPEEKRGEENRTEEIQIPKENIKEKKELSVLNNLSPIESENFNHMAWLEWVEYRASKKKPISELASKKQIKLLLGYSKEDQEKIIDISIQNDYQGLFDLKENKKKNYKEKTISFIN